MTVTNEDSGRLNGNGRDVYPDHCVDMGDKAGTERERRCEERLERLSLARLVQERKVDLRMLVHRQADHPPSGPSLLATRKQIGRPMEQCDEAKKAGLADASMTQIPNHTQTERFDRDSRDRMREPVSRFEVDANLENEAQKVREVGCEEQPCQRYPRFADASSEKCNAGMPDDHE